ncbi:MAG: hypothetical protein HC859_14220 [Bacteroidia bacterium]|nr:hypothetical protein [Bacteroidia bacterium]
MIRAIILLLLFRQYWAHMRNSPNKNAAPAQGVVPDTVLVQSQKKRFSPRKALLYSAVLPGLGQVYNKKYWKVPIVYGGFVAIGYGYNFNNTVYRKLKADLFYILEHGTDGGTNYPNLGEDQVRSFIDSYRRNRDLMVILFGVMYTLQIMTRMLMHTSRILKSTPI